MTMDIEGQSKNYETKVMNLGVTVMKVCWEVGLIQQPASGYWPHLFDSPVYSCLASGGAQF